MTIDPKKLEDAWLALQGDQRIRLGASLPPIAEKVLEAYGVPDLEKELADLKNERVADADKMRLYSHEAAVRQDESHAHAILCDELRQEIIALKAELARFQWRPIEEAPKDGSEILAFWQYTYPGDKSRTCGTKIISWCEEHKSWESEEGCHNEAIFTHFMPLPEATINPSDSAPAGDVDDTNVVETKGANHAE